MQFEIFWVFTVYEWIEEAVKYWWNIMSFNLVKKCSSNVCMMSVFYKERKIQRVN